jgi:hypothetical protein
MAFTTFITNFILVKTAISQTTYKTRILLMSCACSISNSTNHHNLCKNNLSLSSARQLKFEYQNGKPPGPIIMIAQSETGTNSQITFITLFSSISQLCCTFYQPQWTIKICRSKTIFLSQTKHYHMAQLLWPGNQTQIILLSWPFWRAILFCAYFQVQTLQLLLLAGGPTLNKIMIVLSISHSSVIWANNYSLLLTLKYQLHTISSAGLVWRLAKQSSKSTNRNTFQLTYISSLTESITANKPSLLKPWQQHISCALPRKALSLNQPQLGLELITSVGWVTGWNNLGI